MVNSEWPGVEDVSWKEVSVSDLLDIFQVIYLVVPTLMNPKLIKGSN